MIGRIRARLVKADGKLDQEYREFPGERLVLRGSTGLIHDESSEEAGSRRQLSTTGYLLRLSRSVMLAQDPFQ